MAGGLVQDIEVNWPLGPSWEAAVQVAAALFRVDATGILAETRGRGPRPPEAVREPKKIAVYLAVTLSGCDYASLARHVGLHKDTVSSHCAWARETCAQQEMFERRMEVLFTAAVVQMEIAGVHPSLARQRVAAHRLSAREHLRSLQEFMDRSFAAAFDALSDDLNRPFPGSSDDHGKLIKFPGTAGGDA